MRRIAGIDEAGRGPVIGPMVIACVVVEESRISELLEIGVKDSKKLTPKKREELRGSILDIADGHLVEVIDAGYIDMTRSIRNLNRIETQAMAKLLNSLRPDVAQVGSADVVPMRFKSMILEDMERPLDIESVHHAEDRFPVVAAASIIAKTERDSIVSSLRKEYGDFGSGYPSDRKTRAFIRDLQKKGENLPPIVRRSWSTIKSVESE
jgi:ribonuclease HII